MATAAPKNLGCIHCEGNRVKPRSNRNPNASDNGRGHSKKGKLKTVNQNKNTEVTSTWVSAKGISEESDVWSLKTQVYFGVCEGATLIPKQKEIMEVE